MTHKFRLQSITIHTDCTVAMNYKLTYFSDVCNQQP